jgi:NADH:ubiquinone oxidoreductase subunit 6 (subunit J)
VLGGDAAEISANFVEDPVADVEYVTVQELGVAFGTRTHFVLPFEVASLLLTSVLIGAIVIAREDEA